MALAQVIRRQAWRRTDDFTPGAPKLQLISEALSLPLAPTAALIKVHAVSLNYRDANISNGGNPWPVIPNGIICNDAAGEIIAIGDKVKHFQIGDRVPPNTDSEYLTDRSTGRSWLAADEDGVLADYIVFDEEVLSRLPEYLPWESACLIPCAGVTAWTAMKGTGGVSSWALKLARASGLKIMLTSSSDEKLAKMTRLCGRPEIQSINYTRFADWDKEVLKLTGGVGVDLVIENGGTSSLLRSLRCTRRGGIVSQVGYLGKQNPEDLNGLVPIIIDRRITLRGINAGSKFDMEDLCAALESTQLQLDDIIDTVYPFNKAEQALQSLWEGKMVGKIVISSMH